MARKERRSEAQAALKLLVLQNESDLLTGERFSVPDVFMPVADWVKESQRPLSSTRVTPDVPKYGHLLVPELPPAADFTMGPDSRVLHAQPYSIWLVCSCGGSSLKQFEIRSEELGNVLDPDGLYRHILNN